MSVTNSLLDVVGAFIAAEEPLGPNREWNAVNDEQQAFLPLLELLRPCVPALMKAGLLKSKVSFIVQVINDWFKENGFTISLAQSDDPTAFYVGSIYEQLIHWLVPGDKRPLMGKNGQKYPNAVFMDDTRGMNFYRSPAISGTIAELKTKGPDMAYMAMLDVNNLPEGPFGLLLLAHQIQNSLEVQYGFDELRFPMVHIDHQTDVSWLKDIWTIRDTGQKSYVKEAVQQTILKINEEGALAKSATGMTLLTEAMEEPPKPLIIDSPFLFWISRPGFPLPLFTAWVDYPEWKNPGNLK